MKRIRLAILVAILVLVAHHQWNERARHARWDAPLFVAVYPLAGDDSAAARATVAELERAAFASITAYLETQASLYGLELSRPLYIEVGQSPDRVPATPPIGGNFLERMLWVAKARWWRLRFDDQGLNPDIVVLARYFDPESNPLLPHSTGLQPIRLVIANLYAGRRWQSPNEVVLLHELLHTLGASDKYDLDSGTPLYPSGYAEPERIPLYPQRQAELMAGRIAIDAGRAIQAEKLEQTVIGPITAREIGWLRD